MKRKSDLQSLLKKVDRVFGINKKTYTNTFIYNIGPIYGKWQFTVTDNWYRWIDKKYKICFDGNTPEEAIQNFLDYIKLNKISPAKLMGEAPKCKL